MKIAVAGLIPRDLRRLGGFDQPALLDTAITPIAKATLTALDLPAARGLSALVSPRAFALRETALNGALPLRDITVTPTEAREHAHARSNTNHDSPALPA